MQTLILDIGRSFLEPTEANEAIAFCKQYCKKRSIGVIDFGDGRLRVSGEIDLLWTLLSDWGYSHEDFDELAVENPTFPWPVSQ